VAVADVNGNGKLDLITANSGTNSVIASPATGTRFFRLIHP
jgi:hypothetical protein